MLEMIDVSKTYPGGNVALRNINIRIEQGEFVFIVGPSGAGKSTFIKMLFREVLPTSGNILLNDVDILKLTAKEVPYLRRQLGIIFQDYRLLPDRTVYDNVAFAMQVIETPYRKIKRRVMNVLDLVGKPVWKSWKFFRKSTIPGRPLLWRPMIRKLLTAWANGSSPSNRAKLYATN